MKLIRAAAAVATLATCLLGQTNKGASTTAASNAEQTLKSIEQEMLTAVLKGDISANERYLAHDVVFTGPDGEVLDRTRLNADLKSGALKLQSSTFNDMKVRVHGDTAVVTYGTTDKGTYKGKDISGQFRWTDVFERRNGNWQVVATHGSQIQKK
jgi:ketosteroid isomerase-like protein